MRRRLSRGGSVIAVAEKVFLIFFCFSDFVFVFCLILLSMLLGCLMERGGGDGVSFKAGVRNGDRRSRAADSRA